MSYYTNKDYMSQKCTHYDYYIQWNDIYAPIVKANFTPEELKTMLNEDEHLNQPGNWFWDRLTAGTEGQYATRNARINNNARVYSLADLICAIKASCRLYGSN